MNPTFNQLVNFVSNDETEVIIINETVIQEYVEDIKSSWSGGKYYLGGQIKLDPNDSITDALLEKVHKINHDPNMYVCNSAEMASVFRARRQLSEISRIVARYKEIAKKRIMTELNKTKLNTDVNHIIVSMI
jgi:hypothetical protein